MIEDTGDPASLADESYSWSVPMYSPDGDQGGQVTTTPGAPAQVTVTNDVSRVTGDFEITKAVIGGVVDSTLIFSGEWRCTYQGSPATSSDDVVRTGAWSVGSGGTTTVANVLVGSRCQVTAEDNPAAPVATDQSYVWTGTDLGDTVTVSNDGTKPVVTVTNAMTRLIGSFTVVKQVAGSAPADQVFDFTWSCVPGDGSPRLGGTFSLTNLQSWAPTDDVPLDSRCEITEAPTASDAAHTWGTPTWSVSGVDEGQAWVPSADGRTLVGFVSSKQVGTLLKVTNPVTSNGYTVTKTSNPGSGTAVKPGQEITYTVTVTPSGQVPDVTVTDDLSKVLDNATLVAGSISTTTGAAALQADSIVWKTGSITGEPVTLTYKVKVNAGAWNKVLTNVVTSTSDVPEGECATCSHTTTHPTPGWTLQKTSDPSTGSAVRPGQVITYLLTVRNTSKAVVKGATVVDDLSQVLPHATWVGFIGKAGVRSGSTISWAVPDLAVGGTAVLKYQVKVKADSLGTSLVNHAVTRGDNGGECLPGTTSRAAADNCTTNHSVPSFVLEKSSTPAPARWSSPVTRSPTPSR